MVKIHLSKEIENILNPAYIELKERYKKRGKKCPGNLKQRLLKQIFRTGRIKPRDLVTDYVFLNFK